MIKYRARWGNIEEVEIERETASFVVFSSGRKDKKDTGWQRYFDTYEEAVNYIITVAEYEVTLASSELKATESKLNKLLEKYKKIEETKK